MKKAPIEGAFFTAGIDLYGNSSGEGACSWSNLSVAISSESARHGLIHHHVNVT
jgi:hypothetical protein